LQSAAAELARQLENVEPDAFASALSAQVRARWQALLDGILAYRRHPYRRRLADPPVVWCEGTTRVLDYGALMPEGMTGAPVLFVPSLINRAYILDLTQDRSLLRWLAAQGLRPFLVDWDRPGDCERGFTLDDYIAGRLEHALDAVRAATGRAPLVVGYCMGGLLALALALRRQDDVAGLALLATPWDFHAAPGGQGALAAGALQVFEPGLEILGELPVDAIQMLFAALDPHLVPRKFMAFAALDPDSDKARLFVALEDWLNDGVPLAAPVARACLGEWYGANAPARGRWRVAGEVVDPGALTRPCLCLIPARDRIVPPASAAALAQAIPGAQSLTPRAGHIGMVVSAHAPRDVWTPLAAWLRTHAADEAGPARTGRTARTMRRRTPRKRAKTSRA